MRARYLLAFVAVALILALAGCGGGGGGGGGGTIVGTTTNVEGRVVDETGNGVAGAIVRIDTSRSTTIEDETDVNGYYLLSGVPVGSTFTMEVNANGTWVTYDDVQVGLPDTSGRSFMDIAFTTQTPTIPPGAGTPTLSIEPPDTTVYTGTEPKYSAKVVLTSEMFLEAYPAVWTVTGAQGEVSDGGRYFTVSPGAAGSTIKLRAMVRLSNNQVISTERTFTVASSGGEDPPPIPD